MPLYMMIERFREGAEPVYRRFRDRGRMAPNGLTYVNSWVDESHSTCFQVMETDNRALLEEWMEHWADLVDFEVREVVTSEEASRRLAPAL